MGYRCVECGGLFEQPARKKAKDEGWEGMRCQLRDCSPCCGQGFEEVQRCALCGEVICEDGTGALCACCARDAAGRLKRFVHENYTRQEQEALDILTEGISFTCLAEGGAEGSR